MWRDLAQPSHLIIIAVLLLILFGWKRLPDAARSVGRSMRIFKSEVSEMKNDGKDARPSPAASDTVPGGVVPPQHAPTAAQPTQPAQAPQYAAPPAPQYTQQQPVPPVQQPVPAPQSQYQPDRQDSTTSANGSGDRSSNPAL